MNAFHVENLYAGYGFENVINDINFQIDRGQIFGIAGPNGSGKSTILKAICNILPHNGTCGFDVPFEKMNEKQLSLCCAYLPQKSGIALDLSVFEIVLMAYNPLLNLFSSPTDVMKSHAIQVIEEVGLKGKENKGYFQLSGGEKQLCLLARSLVLDTPMLIMDEPENSLDPTYRTKIMKTVQNRVANNKTTALISIHDMNLALKYCDQIMLIKEGTIQSILEPKTETLSEMQNKLSKVYSNVLLRSVYDNNGNEKIITLTD